MYLSLISFYQKHKQLEVDHPLDPIVQMALCTLGELSLNFDIIA